MKNFARHVFVPALLAGLGACSSTSSSVDTNGAAPKGKGYDTPEAAMKALDAAVNADERAIIDVLGPVGPVLLNSGDPVADRADRETALEMLHQKLAFEDAGEGRKIALLGDDGWPMPIPLVKVDGRWHFDSEAGLKEITDRRIGRNELSTLATLHALVDAQREYASEGHDGQAPAFARRVFSTDGKHDGLYWPTAEGEDTSPMGPLVAGAAREGYRREGGDPKPYHGYYYRLLERQGAAAPGGTKDYVDSKGRMTRGFAILAWPAKYSNSGIMTFQVGPQGIVYQKDLGPETDKAVEKVGSFEPDSSWDPTED